MVASYKYDELSRRTVLTYGSDANAVYTYNIGNQLTELKNKFNANQTQVIEYTDYDKVGNRLNMIVDNAEHSYVYDKLYQLKSVDYPAGQGTDTTYWYDRLGSRTSTVAGSTTTYLHNKLNQYYSVASVAYSYDDNGNLVNDGTWEYTYDVENRLTLVRDASHIINISYSYDYTGRRISKTYNSATTVYVYDGDNLIAEYNSGGTLLRKYVYGPKIDEPVCMINVSGQNETKYYYHFDALGSVVAMTESDGDVAEQYRYDVFGVPNATSTIGNRFMFTGREYDAETGNYYYRARYYKPSVGRFLQPDPMNYIAGLNLYTYVNNNPINSTDPSGLLTSSECYDRNRIARGKIAQDAAKCHSGCGVSDISVDVAACAISCAKVWWRGPWVYAACTAGCGLALQIPTLACHYMCDKYAWNNLRNVDAVLKNCLDHACDQ